MKGRVRGMSVSSAICRKKLDGSRGQESICECPLCKEERKAKETLDKEAEEAGPKEEKRLGRLSPA